MVNSRRKGKEGELEFANLLKEHGFDARRGQQYSGIEGEDVVGLPGFHIEVKRVNSLNVSKAMKQAREESQGKTPVVAHRKDREGWLVTMDLEDWIKLIKEG